ncbi:MAG: type II toxin-antitoxin system Phd/YefM family antitoxin [Actinomycetota bacterium]|nr:type II toxin-antitoxin system Phd/YefM family antitoxin [Actinomycetota bacterium]
MAEPTVPASVFKARCLALLDEVATTHRSLVVTKHGIPVARVVPIDHAVLDAGSVTLLADEDDDYFGTEAAWDARR